jgi:hypothetical protein
MQYNKVFQTIIKQIKKKVDGLYFIWFSVKNATLQAISVNANEHHPGRQHCHHLIKNTRKRKALTWMFHIKFQHVFFLIKI